MDGLAKERVWLALRVLSARYDCTIRVTNTEVETLKSYLHGDLDGMLVDDIAVAVIRRELDGNRIRSLAKTA